MVEALLDGPREVAIVADAGPLHRVAPARNRPRDGGRDHRPLLEGRPRVDGLDTAYVCQGFVYATPTTKPGVLAEQLRVRREV